MTDPLGRLSFQLLTAEDSISGYARLAARLALLVIRAADDLNGDIVEDIKVVPDVNRRQTSEDYPNEDDMNEDFDAVVALGQDEVEDEEEDWGLYDDFDEDGGDDEDKDLKGWCDVDDQDYEIDGEGEFTEQNSNFLDCDEDLGDDDNGKDYPILLSHMQRVAARRLCEALANGEADDHLISLFHTLLLSVFTSQPPNAESHRFHLPVEAFIIGSSLRPGGFIRKVVSLAPDLSKLQYFAQFAILRDAMLSEHGIAQYVVPTTP
jgi:hypothetical protein